MLDQQSPSKSQDDDKRALKLHVICMASEKAGKMRMKARAFRLWQEM